MFCQRRHGWILSKYVYYMRSAVLLQYTQLILICIIDGNLNYLVLALSNNGYCHNSTCHIFSILQTLMNAVKVNHAHWESATTLKGPIVAPAPLGGSNALMAHADLEEK